MDHERGWRVTSRIHPVYGECRIVLKLHHGFTRDDYKRIEEIMYERAIQCEEVKRGNKV